MAKSKITIEFKAGWPMIPGDRINILVYHPNGNMNILETFNYNLPVPRPPQYCPIALQAPIDDNALRPVIQGLHYSEAIAADYGARGIVTFTRLGAKITIEAVKDCENITFEVIETAAANKVGITLENNTGGGVDCEENNTDSILVLSTADTNFCNLIKACVTTPKLLVEIGIIDELITTYSLGYLGETAPGINNTGQWKTLQVKITGNGGIADLHDVTCADFIPWTFASGTFNPNNLHPLDCQFFLRNNSVVRTITLKIAFNVFVQTTFNSVYDLFVLRTDIGGNVLEWRHIGGPESLNTYFNYNIDYEGDFALGLGENLILVQHILGSAAGNTLVESIQYTNFEFSISTLENNTVPNTENPICKDVPRGQDYVLEGYYADGTFYSETFIMPQPLSVDDVSIVWVNSPEGSLVTITHSTGLVLKYNIDGGPWQTYFNQFTLLPGNTYTLNVKDEYGCELAIIFTIDTDYYNEPQNIVRYSCSSLHELNVGKYLNLCGRQYTMKIGFVCNSEPNAIKIFKHIQMILNTEYAVKNVCIKTSQKQERLVPGTHMVYRIRESMHSVPLKNPDDFADLRGSWAYIEIEIESIDNQKVDLFSVIAHLRKSSI